MFYGKQPRKEGGFYVVDAPEWAIREYGENVGSKGDLIFENMYKIFLDQDNSPWAYNNLIQCADLLLMGMRWPNRMNQAVDTKNRVDCWWKKFLYWVGLKKHRPYRWQTGMTRDPFIAFYNTCLFLNMPDLIEEVRMPWYCYNPKVWRWHRRLIKDNRKDYVKRLNVIMAAAVMQNYAR